MRKTLFVSMLISSVAVVPAFAQDLQKAEAASAIEDEIVVTAQRKTESVQSVPISVSVVSGDQLDRQQVTQLADLSKTSASVQFGSVAGSGGGGGGAFIRGIGTASLSRSAESAVGIVVDGVVQGNTNVSNLFDVQRVEVLRGPQGTLFGQSVSAGVVNITSIAPVTDGVSGKVAVDLSGNGFAGSEFGKQILRGAINLPISSDSALRVSAYGGRTNGVLYNTSSKKSDSFKESGFRARFLSRMGENVTINVIGDYNYSIGRDGQFFTYINAIVPTTAQVLSACGISARPGNFNHCSTGPEKQTARTYGGSAQIDVELGSVTLTSITALRRNNLFVTGDIDRTNDALNFAVDVRSGVKTNYQQFTQELRLSSDPTQPFTFTVGGFYYDADTRLQGGPKFGGSVSPPNGFVLGTIEEYDAESKNISGFGELRYETGNLVAFGGARLTRSELAHDGLRQSVTIVGPVPNGVPVTTDYGYTDTDISWRMGVQLKPSEDVMIYGTVARGYKNAQLSPIIVVNNVPIRQRVIAPEKPTSYELGVKSTMLDGRLAVNLTGFYQEIRNLQAQTFVTLSDSPVPALLPTNVSKVVSKGFEADIFGRIGNNLTVNASAVYNVAKYPSDYFDQARAPLVGEQIAFAPRFAATISGEFVQPLSDQLEAFISLDGRYRSQTRLSDSRIADALSKDKERFIFGGRIGLRVDEQWNVALFANNLGASRIPSVYNLLLGNLAAFYSTQSQRQIGLQAQLEF
jgi:iron complex outermembrane recepter protein